MNQEDQQNRLELEQQIKNEFSELQKKLDDLKNELQTDNKEDNDLLKGKYVSPGTYIIDKITETING